MIIVITLLILVITLLIFILWHIWYINKDSKGKRLRGEVEEALEALHKAFDLLREDVKEQIGNLPKRKKELLYNLQGTLMMQSDL